MIINSVYLKLCARSVSLLRHQRQGQRRAINNPFVLQDTFVVAEGLQILSTLPAADVSAEMPQEEGDLQRVVRYGSGGEELMGLRFTGNTSVSGVS